MLKINMAIIDFNEVRQKRVLSAAYNEAGILIEEFLAAKWKALPPEQRGMDIYSRLKAGYGEESVYYTPDALKAKTAAFYGRILALPDEYKTLIFTNQNINVSERNMEQFADGGPCMAHDNVPHLLASIRQSLQIAMHETEDEKNLRRAFCLAHSFSILSDKMYRASLSPEIDARQLVLKSQYREVLGPKHQALSDAFTRLSQDHRRQAEQIMDQVAKMSIDHALDTIANSEYIYAVNLAGSDLKRSSLIGPLTQLKRVY